MVAAASSKWWAAAGAGPADRRTMARAFSRCRVKPVFWKTRVATEDSSSPVACAVALAISLQRVEHTAKLI